ncbi:MAG TPA: hypothetical protein PKN61_16180 [Acidobacteriota bacterium]|jgi:hypothetical protein|nr:hypothetical protein [Acidobacteriota bacterium]HNR40576.1 hypothetical protein [Acidobacteriota bacterium]HPB28023.1 hypothetical protein [Acidobacteriota bacterium]HQO25244.1 hypothetical protein [Acidobacteriota bacterium]HQP74062.1 hypothetical protein [Acidobacteriota bacterium]
MKIGGLPPDMPIEDGLAPGLEEARTAPSVADVARPAGGEGMELQSDIAAEAPLVGSAAQAKLAEMAFQAEIVKQQLHGQVANIPGPLPEPALGQIATVPGPMPEPALGQIATIPGPMPEPALGQIATVPGPLPRPAAGSLDGPDDIRGDRLRNSEDVSDETEKAALELQQRMDRNEKMVSTISNITKKSGDTKDDIIDNIK